MFSNSEFYIQDINYITNFNINWDNLKNSSILITGATGLIGTVLIDSLMSKNENGNLGVKIFALSRNLKNITNRFHNYLNNPLFSLVQGDITKKIEINEDVDYVINLASNTHPLLYATEPIETISTIIKGTDNILNFAVEHNSKRVLNVSSVEIYGENRGDVDLFKEDYCGYINCNTLRAGYTEGKRLSESLCQAYIKKHNLNVISMRLGRVYGATLADSDSKSTSQFIRSAVEEKDIILKSKGEQRYSYLYVADAITAFLVLLLKGVNGEAYNISNDENVTFCNFTKILADMSGVSVVFDLPNNIEKSGFSPVQRALMDNEKIKTLGWFAGYNLNNGLERTVRILRDIKNG